MRTVRMLVGLLFFVAVLDMAGGECADNSALIEEFKRVLPQIQIKDIEFNPDLKMYEILMENADTLVYVTQDFRYSFVGTVIDIQGRRNLTEERLTDWKRVDIEGLNFKNAFPITKGNRKIALFLDPNCPYCKKLLGEIKQVPNVSVHVFLYPILGPDSRQRSSAIWNAEDKQKALLSGGAAEATGGQDPVDENLAFGRKHGITSVPTMILEDGRMLKGFMPASRIESYLSQGTSSKK